MVESGLAVRIVRQAKQLSATELAEKAGISTPYLSLVESGKRSPSLEVLKRLAVALDIPHEALILMAQSQSGSLRSRDAAVERLATSVRRLANAERQLRTLLDSEEAPSERS